MRPEKAKSIVGKSIRRSLRSGRIEDLRPALPAVEKLLEKFDSEEVPKGCWQGRPSMNEMVYISDRVNAPHRLAFIKGAIESEWQTFGE